MAISPARPQSRHILTAGTLIMGLALTAFAYVSARQAEEARRRINSAGVFATQQSLVRAAIRQHLDILYSVRSLYWASDFVTRDEFHTFVSPLLEHFPSTRALEWIPRVTHEQRAAFEAHGAREVLGPFRITEATIEGTLEPAAERNVYYPIFYVEPHEDNRESLGYDLASNPARRGALARALQAREVVVSERIRLEQEARESAAVISMLSISRDSSGEPEGIVGGVLRPRDLVVPLMQDAANVTRMTLTDVSDPREPVLLANALAAREASAVETRTQAAQFDVGGREWRLEIDIPLASRGPRFLTDAQGVVAAGIAITVLSLLLISFFTRRQEHRLEIARRARALREVITAQDAERRRVAHEIHDLCGQAAIGIKLRLHTLLERAGGDDDLQEELAAAWQVSAEIVDQLESFSRGLHPPVLDDYGLQSALGRLLSDARRVAGIDVVEVFQGFHADERLPHEHEATLYRVAQESVANVLRHAGARNLSLVCHRTRDSVRLTINDDGCGFDPHTMADAGLGLRGMSERIESLGGRFQLESSPQEGTVVLVELPLTH